MARKQPFPPEADTQPDMARHVSGPAPKTKRRSATTVPPPKSKRGKGAVDTRNSGMRSRKPPAKRGGEGATVDEVTADLSKDPRRERD